MSHEYPEVTIPNTESRTLYSSIVGQKFRISVALPHTYSSSNDNYPVLYLPDAIAAFGIVTETSRTLNLARELPEIIVVGIDYPVRDYRESLGVRFRDLTPSVNNEWLDENIEGFSEFFCVELKTYGTGGAGKFLKCIQEELVPMIETNYRVTPGDKTLFGASLGGLFALFVLLHQPQVFSRYIIASPSIWWDDKITFEFEKQYAAHYTDLPATVFMSVGSLEEPDDEPDESAMRTNMQRLAKLLQGRKYQGLNMKTHIFENETHGSVGPAAVSRGLREVYHQLS